MSVAQFIDHTILKPTTTLGDIEQLCREAAEYRFAAVCVPPYFVQKAAGFLMNGKPGVATVIGFPFGYSNAAAKKEEAVRAAGEGASELDLVMNIAAFRNGDMATLEEETIAVATAASVQGAIVKVIIESGVLSEEEIIRCCAFYRELPVQYLKTSTGYAEQGASVRAVELMKANLPSSMGIKASGGIRTLAFARQLLEAGATRLGCSASVNMVREELDEGKS